MQNHRHSHGFSLIELITVIILIGVLSTFALGKLDFDGFTNRAFYDEFRSALRYAQKLAVSSGCPVRVEISAYSYALYQGASSCTDTTFTRVVSQPFNSAQAYANFNAPVKIVPSNGVEFKATGRVKNNGSRLFTLGGQTINVYSSGLVQ